LRISLLPPPSRPLQNYATQHCAERGETAHCTSKDGTMKRGFLLPRLDYRIWSLESGPSSDSTIRRPTINITVSVHGDRTRRPNLSACSPGSGERSCSLGWTGASSQQLVESVQEGGEMSPGRSVPNMNCLGGTANSLRGEFGKLSREEFKYGYRPPTDDLLSPRPSAALCSLMLCCCSSEWPQVVMHCLPSTPCCPIIWVTYQALTRQPFVVLPHPSARLATCSSSYPSQRLLFVIQYVSGMSLHRLDNLDAESGNSHHPEVDS
jgi:hypothetical protein